ncbi:MAG: ADP-ribosylation factor-like protein [Promethearchaeota archaeon]|jgi:GTPase SAR1 family protein
MEDSLLFFEKEEQSKEKTYKILFTGLDGAGKTSIILALQREFSKIASIEPTRGAQRTTFKLLGREISEWDLGGQKNYLISYLKNPSRYFDDTEIAIYVIDILDGSRILESLSYFYDVVNKFNELKIAPPINIFFHKCDPKLIHAIEHEIENQINDIEKEIRETVNYDNIHFFQTSIYDPYSIMSAMSNILLELYPKSELMQKTIEQYARKLNCEGLIIMDKNSIILGSSFQDDESKKILSSTIAYFLTLNDVFEEMGLDQQEDQIVVRKLGKYFLFKPIIIQESSVPYYLLVLKEHNPFDLYFINKEFSAFANILKDIMQK